MHLTRAESNVIVTQTQQAGLHSLPIWCILWVGSHLWSDSLSLYILVPVVCDLIRQQFMSSPCLWLPDQSQPWLSTVKQTGPSFHRGQKRKYFFTLKKALGESRNQKLINVKYPVKTYIYITQLLQKFGFCILEEIKLTSCN